MKAFLGFLQVGSGIGGVIALFNGQWLLMVVAWAFALLVGFAGSRMVRSVEGVSQLGQEAFANIGPTIEYLRQGRYQSALGLSRSTVRSFRMGGDRAFLPIALTLHAVVLGATGDVPGARQAADEAHVGFRNLPASLQSEAAEMRQVLAFVRRDLDSTVLEPSGFVARFLEYNDAL